MGYMRRKYRTNKVWSQYIWWKYRNNKGRRKYRNNKVHGMDVYRNNKV